MSIEQVLAAQAEADVRQAEALEGIYACLQTIVVMMREPRSVQVANTVVVQDEQPSDAEAIASADGDEPSDAEAIASDDGDEQPEEPKKPAPRGSTRQRKNQERPEPEPEVDPLEDDQPPAEEFSSDDVKDALRSYREINGNAAMMKLFAKYGAQGMGTLKPEDYAAIIADAS